MRTLNLVVCVFACAAKLKANTLAWGDPPIRASLSTEIAPPVHAPFISAR